MADESDLEKSIETIVVGIIIKIYFVVNYQLLVCCRIFDSSRQAVGDEAFDIITDEEVSQCVRYPNQVPDPR